MPVRHRIFSFVSFPTAARLLLAVLVLLNVLKIAHQPLNGASPIDFRPVYVGQQLLAAGRNPYDDAALKREWQRIAPPAQRLARGEPGWPDTPLLYPPWALVLVRLLVGWLPYHLAWPAWYALCLGALGLTCRLWAALIRRWTMQQVATADLLLLALAFKATTTALFNGQPAFVVLALGAGALLAHTHSQWGWAGLWLGLAAAKPTLTLPVALYLLWARDWRSLLTGAGMTLLLGDGALWLYPQPEAMLSSYSVLVRQMQEVVFSPDAVDYPLSFWMRTLTELGTVLEFLRTGAHTWRWLLYAGGWIAVAAFGYQYPINQLTRWLLLALLTLLTTYHLLYDILLLIPLAAWLGGQSRRRQIITALLAAPLVLPVDFLLQKLPLPPALHILYFSLPLSLVALLGWVMYWVTVSERKL